jgi:hypothetical protein
MKKLRDIHKLCFWAFGLKDKFNLRLFIYALTWGCINTFVGLLMGTTAIVFFGAKVRNFQEVLLVKLPSKSGGITLGQIILCSESSSKDVLKHEYGHYLQSLILGPLYLLFVGLPSLMRALWFTIQPTKKKHAYFHFYTEAWADQLGGTYKLHSHKHKHWWHYLVRAKT